MKIVKSLLLVFAGALLCFAAERTLHLRPVHAQDRFSDGVTCIAQVPKEWGEYRGASEYGLVFEDDKGNLRFLLHPTCGNRYSSNAIPNPIIDLLLERK